MAANRMLTLNLTRGLHLELEVHQASAPPGRPNVIVRLRRTHPAPAGTTLTTSVALRANPHITQWGEGARELWIGDLCLKALTPQQIEQVRAFLESCGVGVEEEDHAANDQAVPA